MLLFHIHNMGIIMSALKTMFEKINGQFNLKKLSLLFAKKNEIATDYHNSFFCFSFWTFSLLGLGLAIFINTHTNFHNFLGFTLGYLSSFLLFLTCMFCQSSILSFFKPYKKVVKDYDLAIDYFQYNLKDLDFQVEIFNTLNDFKNHITKTEIDNKDHENTFFARQRVSILDDLIHNLEVALSTDNFEEVISQLESKNLFLCDIINNMQTTDNLIAYKNKLHTYKSKKTTFNDIEVEKEISYDLTNIL